MRFGTRQGSGWPGGTRASRGREPGPGPGTACVGGVVVGRRGGQRREAGPQSTHVRSRWAALCKSSALLYSGVLAHSFCACLEVWNTSSTSLGEQAKGGRKQGRTDEPRGETRIRKKSARHRDPTRSHTRIHSPWIWKTGWLVSGFKMFTVLPDVLSRHSPFTFAEESPKTKKTCRRKIF